jgi:hypothetical protein
MADDTTPLEPRFPVERFLLGLAVLAVLGWRYADYAQHGVVTYRTCALDPPRCDGEDLGFPLWEVTAVRSDGYDIAKVIPRVAVVGPTEGLEVGDVVSVAATFRASDSSVVESFRIAHPYRRWKQALGVVGVVLAFAFLPRAFAIRGNRIVERG